VLREELRGELTIKWYLGDRYTAELTRGEAPYLIRNAQWIEKLPDGNYLVVDRIAQQVIEVTPEYNVIWEYGVFNQPNTLRRPRCAQYIEEEDAILISDSRNNRILLIDKSKKTIKKTLTGTTLGPFGEIRARYDEITGHLFVSDPDNHVMVETDWDGTVHSSFGVYGTSGNDASHLDSPVFVEVDHTGGGCWIVDSGNHRIFLIRDGSFSAYNLIVPYPLTVHRIHDRKTTPITGQLAVASHYTAMVVERDGIPWWFSPMAATFATLTKDQTVIFRRHFQVWEVSLRSTINSYDKWRAQPYGQKVIDESVDADTASSRVPFYGFLHDRTVIRALSTQAATLRIYALDHESGINAGNLPATWNQVDTRDLVADTLETYSVASPAGVMAVDVLMGGVAGNVKVWLQQA